MISPSHRTHSLYNPCMDLEKRILLKIIAVWVMDSRIKDTTLLHMGMCVHIVCIGMSVRLTESPGAV